ncbi:MAG TPA: cytochrome P450 [Roseiflexaceae bacterium]|nr:cytochrome P450 [Roseiflexaceae bacterium]
MTQGTPADTQSSSAHTEPATEEAVEINIADPHFMDRAHAIFADLQARGPVVRVQFPFGEQWPGLFPHDAFFVTRYDEVVETLLSDRFSVDPQFALTPEQRERAPIVAEEFRPLSRNLLSLDQPDHTRLRKLVQPSFTGRAIEALRGKIQRIVDDLLDTAKRDAAARGEAEGERQMDLIEAFAYPMPVTVISDMLGIPREDREKIRGWTENLLRLDRRRGRELDADARAGLTAFTAYLRDLFARKRRNPADDMISQLLQAEEEGDRLDEDEILAMVFLLFLAGHVTTVNLVGSAVVALLTHPDQLAAFQADPELAKNVVEETLRFWGPVDFISRRFATNDLEIAGTPIARGDAVMVGLAAANRDPEHFANPDAFDITRAHANHNVAFGKGIHVCLGAPLARLEGQIALSTLFRRFPRLRLAVPAEELRWGGSFLRGFARLPVLF